MNLEENYILIPFTFSIWRFFCLFLFKINFFSIFKQYLNKNWIVWHKRWELPFKSKRSIACMLVTAITGVKNLSEIPCLFLNHIYDMFRRTVKVTQKQPISPTLFSWVYYNCTWSDHGTLMKHISYPIVSDVTRVCTHTTAAWPWEIVNEACCVLSCLIGATYHLHQASNVPTFSWFLIWSRVSRLSSIIVSFM